MFGVIDSFDVGDCASDGLVKVVIGDDFGVASGGERDISFENVSPGRSILVSIPGFNSIAVVGFGTKKPLRLCCPLGPLVVLALALVDLCRLDILIEAASLADLFKVVESLLGETVDGLSVRVDVVGGSDCEPSFADMQSSLARVSLGRGAFITIDATSSVGSKEELVGVDVEFELAGFRANMSRMLLRPVNSVMRRPESGGESPSVSSRRRSPFSKMPGGLVRWR